MTKEEAKIKMAELCGHNVMFIEDKIYIGHEFKNGVWLPEFYIIHSLNVLEALKLEFDISRMFDEVEGYKEAPGWYYECAIHKGKNSNYLSGTISACAPTAPEAIFNAVKKWMEAEGEE